MRIENASQEHRYLRVRVVHDGRELNFDVSFYSRPPQPTVDLDAIFSDLNNYFAHLPFERQQRIFEAYENAHNQLETIPDQSMLHLHLTGTVKWLYQLIDFEELGNYIYHYGHYYIPPSIKDEYEELEISNRGVDRRETTYLRSDYLELIKLIIYLRPLVPIWGEYLKLMSQRNAFREYQAFSLVSTSPVMNIEAMQGLKRFIEGTVDKISQGQGGRGSKIPHVSAALSGLGSAEFPDWFLSMVVIRKLSIIDVSAIRDQGNIVSTIYSYIDTTLNKLYNRFSGPVASKNTSTDEGEEEVPFVETYKIKQALSDGDLMVLSIFTEDPHSMARRVDPHLETWRLEKSLQATMAMGDVRLSKGQLTLLAWSLSKVLPPRSVENIRKEGLFNGIAVAQASLWRRGHYDIAKLLTATEFLDEDGVLIGGSEANRRIPRDLVERFNRYYPHLNERADRDRGRQANPAIKAIEIVTTDLIRCSWLVYAPPELINEGTPLDWNNSLEVPGDIRVQLARLLLDIVEIEEESYAHL